MIYLIFIHDHRHASKSRPCRYFSRWTRYRCAGFCASPIPVPTILYRIAYSGLPCAYLHHAQLVFHLSSEHARASTLNRFNLRLTPSRPVETLGQITPVRDLTLCELDGPQFLRALASNCSIWVDRSGTWSACRCRATLERSVLSRLLSVVCE